MDYQQKYLKYKNKYLELKQKQEGGFMLSDEKPGFYLDRIIKHLEKYARYYTNYQVLPKSIHDIERVVGLCIDEFIKDGKDEYCSIYDYLIHSYFNSTQYTQTFIRRDGTVIAEIPGFPTHINFTSLIYTSFLLEFELFTLLHQIIHINTISKPNENYLETNFNWCASLNQCTRTRIYKDNVIADLPTISRNFASELDNYFNYFMDRLINNLHNLSNKQALMQQIYEALVPIEHKDHIDRSSNMFDFIFKDWMDRLIKLGFTDDGIISQLEYTMNEIQQSGTAYIAEGTGFFSFIYLYFPGFPKANFGSCITYSLFELYIMSRLHIPAEDMFLVLEIQPDPLTRQEQIHGTWTHTQNVLRPLLRQPHAISHWSTEFKIRTKYIKFRNLYNVKFYNTPSAKFNFKTQRKLIMYALLYPILDSYIFYINKNLHMFPPIYMITQKLTEFINRRKKILEDKISFYTTLIDIGTIFDEAYNNWENINPTSDIQKLIKYGRLILPNNVSITDINIINPEGKSLLYLAAMSGNIKLVEEIIKSGCNVNILNSDGSTPLHGAALGFKIDSENKKYTNEMNRIEIIKLLINNGANKNLVNNDGFRAYNIITFTIAPDFLKIEATNLLQ